MSITTTCPGCGATLSLSESETSVSCQYCGTHFEVNLDQTNPALAKAEPPAPPPPATFVPTAADIYTPPAPAETPAAGTDFFNPPVPGQNPAQPTDFFNPPIPGQAAANPNDLYNPPIANPPPAGQAYTPPPFGQAQPPIFSRISGRGLWLTIGITAFIVFCVSCVCLLALVRGFTN